MKVLDKGHRYELGSLDGDSAIQRLQFVKREGKGYPGNLGHYPGTTSQEVTRCLIDRAVYVNNQIPCWQTRLSIWLYKIIVWLYEHRAAKRHKRKVPGIFGAVYGATCKLCGHVGCVGSCHRWATVERAKARQPLLEVAEWAVYALEHGSSVEVHWLTTVAKEKHAWARKIIAEAREQAADRKPWKLSS